MTYLQTLMQLYAWIFHPFPFLFATSLIIIHREWKSESGPKNKLYKRMAAFTVITALSVIPVVLYALWSGRGIALIHSNGWTSDVLTGIGLSISSMFTIYVWRKNEWGALMPKAILTILAVMTPYLVVSHFWNISGHVTFTMLPSLFLTLLDRKFWPLLIVPSLMIFNRPYLGAHTLEQAVAGYMLTLVLVPLTFTLTEAFLKIRTENKK